MNRCSPRRPALPWITAGLIACLTIAACGGSDEADSPSPPEPAAVRATTATTDTAPTTVEFAPSFPRRTYYGEGTEPDGSTFSVEIGVGELVAASNAERLPAAFRELTSACTVDPERDAFIPMSLTVKNTNEGSFTQQLRKGLRVQGFRAYDQGDLYIEWASGFSSGASCTEPQSAGGFAIGSVSFENVEPGESRTHEKLAVIHQYFTPRHPTGDESVLSTLTVGLFSPAAGLECFGGPGATRGGYFALDGVHHREMGSRSRSCERD